MPQDTPRLPFEIDDTIDPTLVTSRAGALAIELFRQLGLAHVIDTAVTVKQRQRGLPPAQFVESHKDAATVAYDGTRGYQPVVVLWAEQDVILHDQFRDGHVPAGCGNVRVLEQAVANLPEDGRTIFQWHREKAGTVEHTHHVLKNELAAAVPPFRPRPPDIARTLPPD